MSQFKLISNHEANSLCDRTVTYEELSPLNEDWQLSLKSDGTFHLYWHLPLSQRDFAIKQWKRCQSRINAFIGKRSITTVSWEDEPLHPINDLSRFYNPDMSPVHQPLGQGNQLFSNKHLYRFLVQHVGQGLLAAIYDGNSFTFTKDEYHILRQLIRIDEGIPRLVAYASDVIIATLQADNNAIVALVE